LESHVAPTESKAFGSIAPWSAVGGPTLCIYSKQPIKAVAGAKIGMTRRVWTVTRVQAKYVQDMVDKFDLEGTSDLLDGRSWAITNLVTQANKEDKKTKKLIFRIVRCFNCQQGNPTGGEKTQISFDMRPLHLKWMENVHKQCGHSSVDKTMRILVDFYMSYAKKDAQLEEKLFNPSFLPGGPPTKVEEDPAEVNHELQGNLQRIYHEYQEATSPISREGASPMGTPLKGSHGGHVPYEVDSPYKEEAQALIT